MKRLTIVVCLISIMSLIAFGGPQNVKAFYGSCDAERCLRSGIKDGYCDMFTCKDDDQISWTIISCIEPPQGVNPSCQQGISQH